MKTRYLFAVAASAVIALSATVCADEVDGGGPIYVPPAATAAAPAAKGDPDSFRVFRKNGLRMESSNRQFKLAIGGRVLADLAWFREDGDLRSAFGSSENGCEFRAARLYMAGVIYDRVIFKGDYDFADADDDGLGDTNFKDIYVGLKGLPWIGTLKIGHFKEPFSLEQLTSSLFMTFMERSLADRLVPARDSGVAASNTFLDQRLWFGIGGFYDSDGTGDSTDDKWNMSTRMAGTVWKSDDAHLLHVGGNYRYSDLNNLTGVRRAARPEANQGNRYIDTRVEGAGGDPGDSSDDIDKLCGGTSFSPGGGSCRYSHSFGAELAGVYGPFSIQGEWIGTYFDQKDVKNPFLNGWYLFGSWFIMGGGTAPTTRSQRSSAGRGRRTIFSMTEARARSSWPFATRPFGSTARWRAAATSVT